MPRAKAAKVTQLPPPSPALVKVRSEGIGLMQPLAKAVETLLITNEDQYLEADFLLQRIATARAKWRTKIDPVLAPLKAAIDAAKLAMEGAKSLDKDVDGPLAELEQDVKQAMKEYKLEEAAKIQKQKAEAEKQAQALRDEANRKALLAASARTPQMRARLEQARADIEQQAVQVEQQAETVLPVRGAASTTRTVTKVKIADPAAFVAAMKEYQPKAGIYEMHRPPLSLITLKIHKQGDGSVEFDNTGTALDVMTTELAKIFAVQPGVVKSWPGVLIYDDIIIARK